LGEELEYEISRQDREITSRPDRGVTRPRPNRSSTARQLGEAMHFPRFAAGEFREPAKDRFEFGNRTGWTKGNGAPAAQRSFHFDSNVSVEQRD
jgi:hypothetical protein